MLAAEDGRGTDSRIWERIHEVTLPRDPAHRLVEIIAANTGSPGADVRDETVATAALRSRCLVFSRSL